jgi:hypothetical protein
VSTQTNIRGTDTCPAVSELANKQCRTKPPQPTGGLLGAEYMMPVTEAQEAIEHYLGDGEIHHYLPAADVWWDLVSAVFTEAPQLGQPELHPYRMAFVLAHMPPPSHPSSAR